MRKWKKAGTIGLIVVMLCVSGAGCKKKATPERLFKDMAKNGETIESISGKMTANMEFAVEGQSVGMKMDFDLASVEKSEGFQMEGKLLMDIAGTEVSMDMSNYQVKEDDGLMSYTYVNNMWTKSPVESGEEETTLNAGMVEELTKQAKAFTLSEELVTVNGKECFELKGDIGGEFATDVLGEDMLDAFGSLISFTLLYSSKVISRFSSWISISPLSSIAVMSTSFISIKMLAGRISFLYTVIVHGISSSFNSSSDTAPPIPKEAKEEAIDADGSINGLLGGEMGEDLEEDTEEEVEKEDTADVDETEKKGTVSWESLELNVSGKTVTLPCKVSELEAAGLKVDAEEVPADKMVKPGETEFPMLKDKNGNQVGVYCENTGDKDAKVSDCTLTGFYITSRDGEGIVDIALPGNVRLGMTEAELLEKYGEPREKSEDTKTGILTYSWDDELFTRSLGIEFDKDSKKIISIMIDIWDY